MNILAIDTSCDETAIAITKGRKILSNEIYSQILIHKKWGGVVPYLAKRAHEERIDMVVEEAFRKAFRTNVIPSEVEGSSQKDASLDSSPSVQNDRWRMIDYIAVTNGPGLAPALEVGITKAKELATKYNKKIIAINHMEGHIYSCFAQNSRGNPPQEFHFPYIALLVSGGHTELVLFKDHINYEVIGETIDDAAGEALDKAAKMLGLGYPGGPVIEKLARSGKEDYHYFPRPIIRSHNLDFSYSGLKTSLFYYLMKINSQERINNLNNIAASYQKAIFSSLLFKLEKAMEKTQVNHILGAGGVMANQTLRGEIRKLVKKKRGVVLFPPFKALYGDNAAMIGIAAYFKAKKRIIVGNAEKIERVPRLRL